MSYTIRTTVPMTQKQVDVARAAAKAEDRSLASFMRAATDDRIRLGMVRRAAERAYAAGIPMAEHLAGGSATPESA